MEPLNYLLYQYYGVDNIPTWLRPQPPSRPLSDIMVDATLNFIISVSLFFTVLIIYFASCIIVNFCVIILKKVQMWLIKKWYHRNQADVPASQNVTNQPLPAAAAADLDES